MSRNTGKTARNPHCGRISVFRENFTVEVLNRLYTRKHAREATNLIRSHYTSQTMFVLKLLQIMTLQPQDMP